MFTFKSYFWLFKLFFFSFKLHLNMSSLIKYKMILTERGIYKILLPLYIISASRAANYVKTCRFNSAPNSRDKQITLLKYIDTQKSEYKSLKWQRSLMFKTNCNIFQSFKGSSYYIYNKKSFKLHIYHISF